MPVTEFPGDLVCPKCGTTDCVAPAVSFHIQTNNGTHYINDPDCVTLSVWVTEQEENHGLRSAKISHHLDENKEFLANLTWVCDLIRKPENDNGIIYQMFFAHQGLFHFVPNHQ